MSDERDAFGPADILPVEDNPGDVRLTKAALDAGGFRNPLHVATDGVEAMDFLSSCGERSARRVERRVNSGRPTCSRT